MLILFIQIWWAFPVKLPPGKCKNTSWRHCCCQATSHYLSQRWLGSRWPYGGTGSQYVQGPHNETIVQTYPDSKVHGANMGSIWGQQDPGGPHVGPMNLALWVNISAIHPMKYANSFIVLFAMAILSVPLDSWGKVSITCAISLQRNVMKYNYIFIWAQCMKKRIFDCSILKIIDFLNLLIENIEKNWLKSACLTGGFTCHEP